MMRIAALVLLAACTCGAEPEEDPEREPEPSASPRDYFPASAGDRWRMNNGATLAVTTTTESGVAVFFGSDRTSAERYRVTDDAVLLVDPTDRAIAVWLDKPMEVGHGWSYAIGDMQCEVRYAGIEQSAEVAGLSFEHCVEVRRRCLYPEGKPFPAATTEMREETWCPHVGRVAEVVRFDPPPAIDGVAATRRFVVSYYRVQGAPAPPLPETFDCDALLLLESDVQAACGPRFTRLQSEPSAGCTMRFGGPEGELSITAQRLDHPAADDDIDELLGGENIASEGDLRVSETELGLAEGAHVVAITTSDACPMARASRLAPLLRSLLRQ